MKRVIGIILGVLLPSLVAGPAAAQLNVARYGTERNHVYTTFGLDPALVGSLGYGRVIPMFGHDFQLYGDAAVVVARLDANDFRARLGTRTSVARWRSVHVTGSATFITRGTDNSIYRGLNLGADITATAGIYRPGWFAAGEVGKDKAIITHVTHSDWYRSHFYADAKDGWYLDAGGTYHFGAVGGLSLGRTEIFARTGWLMTEDRNALTPPFYGSVGVGFAF